MTSCAYALDVEDLALGHVAGAERVALEAHVAECAACRASLAAFEEERALFARRADAVALPPHIGPAITARVRLGSLSEIAVGAARAAYGSWRVVHGVLGVAACVAAFLFVASAGVGSAGAIGAVHAAHAANDEPVAAAELVSMPFAHLASFVPQEPVACVTNEPALSVQGSEALACGAGEPICAAVAVARP